MSVDDSSKIISRVHGVHLKQYRTPKCEAVDGDNEIINGDGNITVCDADDGDSREVDGDSSMATFRDSKGCDGDSSGNGLRQINADALSRLPSINANLLRKTYRRKVHLSLLCNYLGSVLEKY